MSSQSNRKSLQLMGQVEFLGQSTVTQMPLVSANLAETYGVISPIVNSDGEVQVTDWDLVQLANAGLLASASRVAFETSQIYRARKAELSEFRRLRGEGVGMLSRLHTRHRASFLGSYNEELLPLVGLEVPKSRTYVAVRDRCQDSARRMRVPGLIAQLGDPIPGTPALDFGAMAQGMEDALVAYDVLKAQVEQGVKVRDEADVTFKGSEARLRGVYINVARVQEGLYRLAGLEELANRIRMTIPVRKPTPVVEPDPVVEPEPVDESGSESSP